MERAATLEDIRAEVLTPDRLNSLVFGGFAAVALAIAVVGVAGVLAFSVSGRTREFGIRLAIGSQPRHLLVGVDRRRRRNRGGGHRRRRGMRVCAGASGRQLFPGHADAGRLAGGGLRGRAAGGRGGRVRAAGGARRPCRCHAGAAIRVRDTDRKIRMSEMERPALADGAGLRCHGLGEALLCGLTGEL